MFKLKKLNARGLAHYVVPLAIIVLVGVIGTYLIVGSHADPVSKKSKSTGTLRVVVAYQKLSCLKTAKHVENCKAYADKKTSLLLYGFSPSLLCDGGVRPTGESGASVGSLRSFRCTPGSYYVKIDPGKQSNFKSDGKYYAGEFRVDVKANTTATAYVGEKAR